jgi:uncharacterized membrane protein
MAAAAARRWEDRYVEIAIARLLRIGVFTAWFVVLGGALIYLHRFGRTAPHYGLFAGEPADLCSVAGVVRAALHLRGRGIIQFGLLLLIATPIARVVFSVLAFALERDRLYVVLTLIVLTVLLFSLSGYAG